MDTSSHSDSIQVTRHGLDDSPEEKLDFMDNLFRLYYCLKRHDSLYNKEFRIEKGSNPKINIQDWRLGDKQKTVSVALVLCLNIGVDPPDVVKTSPCAKLECWIDPYSLPASKALDAISKNLQQQYEVWQPRARYKPFLDPTVEDTKKLCCSLRRSSKDERILFHYNGHGVPKPTNSGEIWVFNKTYTQYIPISILDLQSWLGSPCMYVYDCSSAGNIIKSFKRFNQQREQESHRLNSDSRFSKPPSAYETIQFAACDANETLPMSPDLPADLFSSCLTTPIEMAMRWFVIRNPLKIKVTPEMVLKLPGRLNDRRTPLGDLSWVFTSITDTIAWSLLPPSLFTKLFRQDLMMAALFRNFLLADRIMRTLKCHPISVPKLPETHNHPLWKSWDMALDLCLSQIPDLTAAEENGVPFEYKNSPFFTEQLTAFEIWLSQAQVKQNMPEQLPIVLQVLLSQIHRARALKLLSKFFDLGLWAINAALLVGIFPYVLKLLQSPAVELKPSLTFIWARIMPVDNSCQNDLLKDNGYLYFIDLLKPDTIHSFADLSRNRAECAVILAFFCKDFPVGKQSCLKHNILSIAVHHFTDHHPILRQWICIMLGQIWKSCDDAKWAAFELSIHESLISLLRDPIPEVRAAAVYALSTLFEIELHKSDQIQHIEHSIAISLIPLANDGSPIVRKEWVVFISQFIYRYKDNFLSIALETIEEDDSFTIAKPTEDKSQPGTPKPNRSKVSHKHTTPENERETTDKTNSLHHNPEEDSNKLIYNLIWKLLLILTLDAMPQIAQAAQAVVDQVHYVMVSTKVSEKVANSLLHLTPPSSPTLNSGTFNSPNLSPQPPNGSRRSQLANTLRRSASYSLRSLYNFGSTSDTEIAVSKDKGSSSSLNQLTSTIQNLNINEDTDLSMILSTPEQVNGTELATIKSFYLDWCAKCFIEPHLIVAENEEPGSKVYHQRLWRRYRNDKVVTETEQQYPKANQTRWTTEFKNLQNENQPNNVLFHRYDNILIASDERNYISVWNWEESIRLNKFRIFDSGSIGVSSLKLINEEDDAILAVAANDGNVSLYQNYSESAKLVSGFRAHSELQSTRKLPKHFAPQQSHPSIVMEWQQSKGNLIVGGEPSSLRIWDVASERISMDLPTRSTIGITSLTSDRVGGYFLTAGFQDGSVRAYDSRLPPRESMIRCWREHHSVVVGCHLQLASSRELVTASSAGEIKLWDLRSDVSLQAFTNKTGITSFAVHDQVPLVATGTAQHGASVYTMDGQHLGTTFHYQGASGLLLSQRIAPIYSLNFHPSRMVLATGSGGGISGPFSTPIDRSSNISLFSWDSPVFDNNSHSAEAGFTASYNTSQLLSESNF
ncbi:hypothetical protein K502DRAFT_325486 [Neoconidiobolus thromboides FSU 785]|nr:hypothetical protein K502DRAFT_325486 [Neoconidiobolus thromboides FSU 785]